MADSVAKRRAVHVEAIARAKASGAKNGGMFDGLIVEWHDNDLRSRVCDVVEGVH